MLKCCALNSLNMSGSRTCTSYIGVIGKRRDRYHVFSVRVTWGIGEVVFRLSFS